MANHNQWLPMFRVARAAQGSAAISGLLVAWMSFEWLGNPWDHCDYPEECLGSWFPHSFQLIQYVWALTVLLAAVGVLAAIAARQRRADVLIVVISWAVLFMSLAITPMYGSGQDMTMDQIENNPFLWDSVGYRAVGAIMAVAALMLGWQAVRGSVQEDHHPMTVHHS
jgi:hypothetical protein